MSLKLRRFIASPWGLLLVAALLRLMFLGKESLWYDEALTVRDSFYSIEEIINNRWDPHPPLYYLLLHGWMKSGAGDAYVRILSAIFGTLTVPIFFTTAKRLLSEEVAYATALLFAFTPLNVWYSQEARMYAMLVFWGACSTYFALKLLQGEISFFAQAGYIITTALGLYSQYTMILLIIAQTLLVTAQIVAYMSRNGFIRRWGLLQIGVLVLYLPWISNLPGHWNIVRTSTNYPLWFLVTTPFLIGFSILGIIVWIAIILWLREQTTTKLLSETVKQRLFYLLLTIAFGIFAGYLALSMTNRMTTLKRQTFIFIPLLTLILMALIANLPRWKYWSAGLISICLGLTLVNAFTLQKPQWREAVQMIEASAGPSDVIVLSPGWLYPVLDYYSHDILPYVKASPSLIEKQASSLPEQYARCWLISNRKHEMWSDPQRRVVKWFAEEYSNEDVILMGELELYVFNWEK